MSSYYTQIGQKEQHKYKYWYKDRDIEIDKCNQMLTAECKSSFLLFLQHL